MYIIQEAMRLVESNRRSEIRHGANGGNSILIVCEPMRELEYITQLKELLNDDRYSIIDLNQCLIEFVKQNELELSELYDQLQSTTHEIFKAPPGEVSDDLFKRIINNIEQAFLANTVPVLINTGSLYGTGIHNIHIMENDIVMRGALPLIILYPATVEPERLMFLGKFPASQYRCMIIQ